MKTYTISEAKMKLGKLVDSVQSTHREVVITKRGAPAAVLVNYQGYESLKETFSVCSDEEFMKEVRAGLKALREKKAHLYSLEELFS